MITQNIILGGLILSLVALSTAQRDNYPEDDFYEEDRPVPQRSQVRSHSRPSSNTEAPRAAPVAILKQINRHNEDGSYTYGYEGADGSFKIETKLTTGEVMGKYGYVDDTGKVRVVEYGANKYGFMPSGEGITVAEPTLVDETTDRNGNKIQDYEDEPVRAQAPRPAPRPAARPAPRPAPKFVEDDYPLEPSNLAPERPVFTPSLQSKQVSRPAPAQAQYSSQQRSAPRPIPVSSAPVPPRPVVPGASPVYHHEHDFPSEPREHRPPTPSFSQGPAPVYEQPRQAPRPAPRPAPLRLPVPQRAPSGGSGGILDQLALDYALPQGGNRQVDISFGSY